MFPACTVRNEGRKNERQEIAITAIIIFLNGDGQRATTGPFQPKVGYMSYSLERNVIIRQKEGAPESTARGVVSANCRHLRQISSKVVGERSPVSGGQAG
jgi:hypothetical protein